MKAAQAIKNFNCKNLYTSLTSPPHNKTHKTKSCPCKTRALQMKTLLYAAGVLFFKPRMGGLVKLLPSRSMRTGENNRVDPIVGAQYQSSHESHFKFKLHFKPSAIVQSNPIPIKCSAFRLFRQLI